MAVGRLRAAPAGRVSSGTLPFVIPPIFANVGGPRRHRNRVVRGGAPVALLDLLFRPPAEGSVIDLHDLHTNVLAQGRAEVKRAEIAGAGVAFHVGGDAD